MSDDQVICEARIGGRWQVLSIEEALDLSPRPTLRCIECHGPVRPHCQSNNGMRAHFEHRVPHPGCSRKRSFSGRRSPHPDALA